MTGGSSTGNSCFTKVYEFLLERRSITNEDVSAELSRCVATTVHRASKLRFSVSRLLSSPHTSQPCKITIYSSAPSVTIPASLRPIR
eukprot:scaffold2787_cov109-Skeletonema_marinoi.AAC.1